MKWLKRISIAFFSILILLIIAASIIATFYQKEVKQYFITQINKQLVSPISVKSYNLSLLKKFPYASLELQDVAITENTDKRVKNNLLSAQSVFLQFNIFDLFSDNYKIKRITVNHASLNIHIDEKGKGNYIFWKKSNKKNESDVAFQLNDIELKSIKLNYFNEQNDTKLFADIGDLDFEGKYSQQKFALENIELQETHFEYANETKHAKLLADIDEINLKGNFGEKEFQLTTNGNLAIKNYSDKDVVWLENRKIIFETAVDVDKTKHYFAFAPSKISVDGVAFAINGNVTRKDSANYDLHIALKSKNQNINTIQQLIPERFKKTFQQYNLDGKTTFTTKINGILSATKSPHIEAAFKIKNATATEPKSDVALKNIFGTGKFTYYKSNGKRYSKLVLDSFRCNLDKNNLSGALTISDFWNPYLKVKLKAAAPVKSLVSFFKIDTVQNPNGTLDINLKFAGYIKNLKKITPEEYQKLDASGEINFKNVAFQIEKSNYRCKNLNGTLIFADNNVKAQQLTFDVQHSDFSLNGTFKNLLVWLFTGEKSLDVEGTLKSNHLYLDELLASDNSDDDNAKYTVHFPDKINCDFAAEINNFVFQRFHAQNIKSDVKYANNELNINNLSFDAMQGKTNGTISFEQNKKGNILTNVKANLSHIDMRKLFYQFKNFGQNAIGAANLKGSADVTDGTFSAVLDSNLNMQSSSIIAQARVKINKGELIDYKPIYALSKYVSVSELNDIKFSTLETDINIANKTIAFPKTDIHSSAMNLSFFGTHTFDNKINYHFKIAFNQILWNKAKKAKKENSEFGYVEDNGLHALLFLKMTGTVDKPDISYDRKGWKKQVKNDFKERTNDLKKVLHDEWGMFKKDSTLDKKQTKPQEAPYKIEWNDGSGQKTGSQQNNTSQDADKQNNDDQAKKRPKKKKSFFGNLTTPNKDEYVQPK